MFDTETPRLFVEHEKKRDDMRGPGDLTEIDDIEVADFLRESGPGPQRLMQLLAGLFEDCRLAA